MARSHRITPSRGELLGHRHMSSGGPYVTTTVYMFHDTQVYQEEPSGPTAGLAKVKAQERQGKPSSLTTGKVEVQAQTPKVPGGAPRRRSQSVGRGLGGSGKGRVIPAREKGALTALWPRVRNGPPTGLQLRPERQRRCRRKRPEMPLKI